MSLPDDWLTNIPMIVDPHCPPNTVYMVNLNTMDDETRAKLQAMIDVQPVLDGQVTVEVGAVPE